MAIKFYLAMMAQDFSENPIFPENPAFITCPFSENMDISQEIPPNAIPVVTDASPVTADLSSQFADLISSVPRDAVLLDFQQPGQQYAGLFIRKLQRMLSCPVVVSEAYAADWNCPVFLSPLPHYKSLKEHIAPWVGREIWMDVSPLGQQLLLTEQGATVTVISDHPKKDPSHAEPRLHCHYTIATERSSAKFTFWRTEEDWHELFQEMELSGIHHAVGLYQEWAKKNRSG